MDKLKQWVALAVVGCLAVLAAGWFLVVSPKRAAAEDLATQATEQQSRNAGLQQQLAVLKSQAKSLPRQQARLAAVAAKIPDNPALPALIRALDAAAAAAGVELVSITPTAPTALTAGSATTPVAPSGVIAPAKVAGATSATTGLLSSIGVTVNVVGGYFEVEQFLDGLESLPRAFKVTAFTATPGTNPVKPPPAGQSGPAGVVSAAPAPSSDDGRILTATVSGQVFLAPGRAAATPVTLPVAPSAPAAGRPVATAGPAIN